MQGQDFLIDAIEDSIPEDETPDTIKHLSRTTMLEAKLFPAVFVEAEPYDYNQDTGQNDILMITEKYNLIMVVESVNMNKMTENDYKNVIIKLDELTDNVIVAIMERVPNISKIANLKLGTGESFDGTISSVPVMWRIIPVTLILMK